MRRSNRRQFIKRTGLGVAGMAAVKWPALALTGAAASKGRPAIPPHRSLLVPGVHAYADQISVAAGQTISFHISSSVAYQLSVCRLGLSVDDPAGDQMLHQSREAQPNVQPIHPGSYVHVEKRLNPSLRGLTLECWIRPWK